MLTEPLVQQLTQLRLHGMAQALEQQIASPDRTQLSFEDRLGLMIQHEITERASFRLAQRLRWARLPLPACLEDLDTRTPRGLDRGELHRLTELSWIREHLNVLITGPCEHASCLLSSLFRSAGWRILPRSLLSSPEGSAKCTAPGGPYAYLAIATELERASNRRTDSQAQHRTMAIAI